MILDFKGMAMESGSSKAGASAEDETAAIAAAGADTTAILLFRSRDEALKAAPLSAVSRIEEIETTQIEQVDGRSVIQYRGELMPVIGADGKSVDISERTGSLPLLVFARDGRAAGLLVEEIVDIVETTVVSSLKSGGPGSLGSLIIGERATELIDVDYYWALATGERMLNAPAADSEMASAPAAAPPVPLKQLLVVDQSPFCQLLLRPLLAQAGYQVTVAVDPEAALALHDAGEHFDLIMVDSSATGPEARRFAQNFSKAGDWHATPLLGLGLHKPGSSLFDETTLLEAVSESLDLQDEPAMRGAA